MTQAFFDAGEQALVVARFDIDDAVWREACLGQRWSEQVRPGDDPEHLASRPGGYSTGKEGSSGSIDCAITPAGDFVERTESQAAGWQA